MIIELKKLTDAIAKVKSFAQDIKTVPGILLRFGENQMEVCYSDGHKAIIERIETEVEESERIGDIVVNYQVFTDVINNCQPAGVINCDELEITVSDNSTLIIEAVKYVLVGKGDDEEPVKKPVSKFRQEIKYNLPGSDIRYGVLTRMNYDDIFSADVRDSWNKGELQNTLSRLSKDEAKVCYCSSQLKAAFAVNLNHTVFIPKEELENCGFSLSAKLAKYIVEILNKLESDEVLVAVEERRYCKMTTPDEKVGIWFEMSPASRVDLDTLKSYESKAYAQYQIVFNRYALQDAVKCAIASDNTESTSMSFVDSEDGLVVSIVRGRTDSKAKEFAIIAEEYKDNTGKLMDTTVPISLKAFSSILDNCSGPYLLVDINDDETGKYLRCKDCIGKENGEPIVDAIFYMVSAK